MVPVNTGGGKLFHIRCQFCSFPADRPYSSQKKTKKIYIVPGVSSSSSSSSSSSFFLFLQRRENVGETGGAHNCGLFRAHRYHLELN